MAYDPNDPAAQRYVRKFVKRNWKRIRPFARTLAQQAADLALANDPSRAARASKAIEAYYAGKPFVLVHACCHGGWCYAAYFGDGTKAAEAVEPVGTREEAIVKAERFAEAFGGWRVLVEVTNREPVTVSTYGPFGESIGRDAGTIFTRRRISVEEARADAALVRDLLNPFGKNGRVVTQRFPRPSKRR